MPVDVPPLRFVVVGTPRSGTTLVQALVSELRGVVVPPETHFLSLFGTGFAERHPQGADHAAVREELARYRAAPPVADLSLDPDAVVASLPATPVGPLAVYRAIVGHLAPHAEVLGEKTPDHLLWWRPLTTQDVGLRVIWVLRDPRAVVASNRNVPFGMARDALNAERWRLDREQLVAARAALGDRLLVARYEDVVADPAAARAAFAAHLGRAPEDLVARPPDHALHHERETWKRRVAEPTTRERVEAWRAALAPRDVRRVEAVVGRALSEEGYEVSEGSSAARAWASLAEPIGDRVRRARLRHARRARQAAIEGITT